MDNTFVQLAIILGLASSLGFVCYKLKLPIMIAYLLGGLLIASAALFDTQTSKALSFLPEIGLAFVLFLVGMELDLREIKNIGKPVLIAGLTQILITTIAGSTIARVFGFTPLESVYMGAGLSFSSTILVIKLLTDKKDITALYGKLVVGVLLLEDLVAVLVMLGLTVSHSALSLSHQDPTPLITFLIKVVLLFAVAIILNQVLLKNLFKTVSGSSELLFLTALAFLFIYVSFALFLGFTTTIGAFLAGVSLASSPYHFQIQGKIKPLRDFFVALFFVYLGTKVNFADLSTVYPVILIFTTYALVLKPLIFMLLWGGIGLKKHTIFKAAISTSQISEFSMIIILMGIKNGSAGNLALTTMALSSVLTMLVSSLLVTHANQIYKQVRNLMAFFERKNFHHQLEHEVPKELITDHIIVIGAHRVGGEIARFLKREKIPHLVLDFDPHQIETMLREDIKAIYGDVSDPEILDCLNLDQARMVISTSQDQEDNLLLLEELKSRKVGIPIVARATSVEEAKVLYKKGTDFVIIPEILAGDLLLEKIKSYFDGGNFFKERARIEMDKLSKKPLAWE